MWSLILGEVSTSHTWRVGRDQRMKDDFVIAGMLTAGFTYIQHRRQRVKWKALRDFAVV
jgi:hypothetical protein